MNSITYIPNTSFMNNMINNTVQNTKAAKLTQAKFINIRNRYDMEIGKYSAPVQQPVIPQVQTPVVNEPMPSIPKDYNVILKRLGITSVEYKYDNYSSNGARKLKTKPILSNCLLNIYNNTEKNTFEPIQETPNVMNNQTYSYVSQPSVNENSVKPEIEVEPSVSNTRMSRLEKNDSFSYDMPLKENNYDNYVEEKSVVQEHHEEQKYVEKEEVKKDNLQVPDMDSVLEKIRVTTNEGGNNEYSNKVIYEKNLDSKISELASQLEQAKKNNDDKMRALDQRILEKTMVLNDLTKQLAAEMAQYNDNSLNDDIN